MKSAGKVILLILSFLCVFHRDVSATSMAFGYLANKSNDTNFNHLEILIPNSYANALKNKFDINVMKPKAVEDKLKKIELPLQKDYRFHEVPEILGKLNCDYFIYGNFIPLADNRIKISIHLYRKGARDIFTFASTGRLETAELFKLVDQIALILINFIGKEPIYKIETIKAGSKIGILTNLDGEELNLFYCPFMTAGYKLASVQGNTFSNHVSEEIINKFTLITTSDNSLEKISKTILAQFYYGSWAGEKYIDKITRIKKMAVAYDLDFTKTKIKTLNNLQAKYRNTIDYLLIIGFSSGKNTAWLRCINMKSNNLVWIQNGIDGKSVEDITGIIIKNMAMLPKFPEQK